MAQYPENTVRGMADSAPHVDVVELDVRRCATGELVVFHDADLDRITDATGLVSETAFDELRELTVHDSDEPIPTLPDVFEAVPDAVGINVELKVEGVADDAFAVADRFDNDVVVSSFSAAALEEAAAAGFRETAALFKADPADSVARADSLDCSYVHPNVELCLESDVVERAHECGMDVNAWTVRTTETASALGDAGVDGLILDRWDVI